MQPFRFRTPSPRLRRWLAFIPLLFLVVVSVMDLDPFDPDRRAGARALSFRPATAAVVKPWGDLGARFAELTRDTRRVYDYRGPGALVVWVEPGGPADREGMQEGDIVTQFENRPVKSAAELAGRVRRTRPGSLAGMHVWREGNERWLGLLVVGEAQPPLPPPAPPPAPGATADDVVALGAELAALRLQVAALADSVAALRARVGRLEGTGG